MAINDNKIWTKTKDLAKKAKDKTSQQFKKLKQKSHFDESHLTTGEFIIHKDFRELLSWLATFLLVILLLLAFGEVFFMLVAYTYLSNYSYIVKDFAIYSLFKYMWSSLAILAVFAIVYMYVMESYRKAEEELLVSGIRTVHIYIKLSFYSTFLLIGILITLYVFCSNYFYYLYEDLKTSMPVLIRDYKDSIEIKEQMDRMQWYYDCCGTESYTDWLDKSICSDPNKDQKCVPFSCCRKEVSNCHFSDIEEETSDHIYSNGCRKRVIHYLDGLKNGVQWYRLTQLVVLFLYMILVYLIQHSLHSEYIVGAHRPVAKFPTFYVVIFVITLLILIFCFFKNYS